MKNEAQKINVFEYQNYRAFLKDWYDYSKKNNPSFSFRSFSHRAGFKTSNFLLLVMKGERNLTEESIHKFALGLKLNKQEQEFFRDLVFLDQSKTHEEKDLYYQRLLRSKKFRQLKPIESQRYEYYSKWYHPIIREMVVSKKFNGNMEWLSEHIFPSITTAQSIKSVQLLEKLGFITQAGPNRWKQTSTVLTTGPEIHSVVIHNYHKELLNLAKEVMDKPNMPNRDISNMTLGVKKERVEELIQKIRKFRKEILEMVSEDQEPEEVVQLNIQFFPVTKKSNGDKSE